MKKKQKLGAGFKIVVKQKILCSDKVQNLIFFLSNPSLIYILFLFCSYLIKIPSIVGFQNSTEYNQSYNRTIEPGKLMIKWLNVTWQMIWWQLDIMTNKHDIMTNGHDLTNA